MSNERSENSEFSPRKLTVRKHVGGMILAESPAEKYNEDLATVGSPEQEQRRNPGRVKRDDSQVEQDR